MHTFLCRLLLKGKEVLKGTGRNKVSVWGKGKSWSVLWRSSRWQRRFSTAIQSQTIPLMCCHFCDLGAGPTLQWKRRSASGCARTHVRACLCTSGTCTKALTNRAVVLIYSLVGQLVPAWNHMGYFIFPKYKPQALDTHTESCKSNVSPGATVCKNSILHTMLPCRHYCPVTVSS